MANIRLIKQRIKSAQNIAKITKAMELVAASKMKKAQSAAIAGKTYAQKIYEMVIRLADRADASHHPLLRKITSPTGKRLVIVLSSNKGLCGGLNTNLFRFLLTEYANFSAPDWVSLGKKGTNFLVRSEAALQADFSETVGLEARVSSLTDMIVASFTGGQYDQVDLVYNDFVSVVRQTPKKKTILPLTIESSGEQKSEKEQSQELLVEPSIPEVFNVLLPHYLENQIRDAVLESEASEHSSRMIAMRNATDNALSLTDELTLLYNKARQEKITYEITDMVTARLAVAE